MTSTPIPVATCPHCGYRMDMATEAYGDTAPKPGDISLCAKCGVLAVFDEQMRQRAPTPAEALAFNADPRVIRAQIVLRGYTTFLCNPAQEEQRKKNGKGTTGEQH